MSIILHTIGIVVKIIAFKLYGFYALAIIMSIKSLIGSALLVFLYNKYIHKIEYSKFLIFFIKVLFLTISLLIVSLWLKSISINIFLIVFLSTGIYMAFLKIKFDLMRLK